MSTPDASPSTPTTKTQKVYGRGQPIPFKLPDDWQPPKPRVKKAADEEILNNLDQSFYDEKANVISLVMKDLPMEECDKWLEKQLYEKERAFDLMNDKLYKKVMDNYDAFGE